MDPCKRCGGSRFVSMPREQWPPDVIQPQMPCPACSTAQAAERELQEGEARLRAAWACLPKVSPARSSPLLKRLRDNLRVRCNLADLRSHVALVVRSQLRQEPLFHLRVCTDIDLVTSWLYSANEIGDADASSHIMDEEREDPIYRRMPDLVNPPDLLVLRLGIKLAPNKALPDLVLETLYAREHLDRPTWIIEKAGDPLTSAFPCYSKNLMEFLSDWPCVDLSTSADEPSLPTPGRTLLPTPIPKPSIDFDRTTKALLEGKPREKSRNFKRKPAQG